MTLTCGLFPLSAGTEQEGKLPKKRLEVRLEVWDARKALPQGYRGKEVRVKTMAAPGFSYLPDAGGTVIKEAVLSRRGPFTALGSG